MTVRNRERWVNAGPVRLGLSLPEDTDRRIAQSPAVRSLLRPLVRRPRAQSHAASTIDRPDTWRDHLAGWKLGQRSSDPAVRALQDQVAAIDWYHAIDLGNGVVTPGKVDHRPQLPLYRLPESLEGMRCLDVASMDGFWAFEMERRGAAEVVAIDVPRRIDVDMPYAEREELRLGAGEEAPPSAGFEFAKKTLGSKVKKYPLSVYNLSPEIVGEFDFIFLSDLLLHLRDPQLALESVRKVCRGVLHVADVCDPDLETFGAMCVAEYPLWATGKFFYWWRMNVNTIRRMLEVAGFNTIDELSRLRLNLIQASNRDAPLKVVLQASVRPVNVVPGPRPESAQTVAPPSRLHRHRWARVGPVGFGISIPVATDTKLTRLPGTRSRSAAGHDGRRAALPGGASKPLPSRRPEPADVDRSARTIIDRVAGVDWHDAIDVGGGVVTPGLVDRRPHVSRVPLPANLAGMRCLVAVAHDGFWAFELERRGAAEVVAIRGTASSRGLERGYSVAHDLLGSAVKRMPVDVYELSPDVHGTFDLVVADDLLGHVHDPQLALDRIRGVCRGRLLVIEPYHEKLEPYGGASLAEYRRKSANDDVWWMLSRNAIRRMVSLASFGDIEEGEAMPGREPVAVLTARVLETARQAAPQVTSPASA